MREIKFKGFPIKWDGDISFTSTTTPPSGKMREKLETINNIIENPIKMLFVNKKALLRLERYYQYLCDKAHDKIIEEYLIEINEIKK